MAERTHDMQLADEQARNAEYLVSMQKKVDQQVPIAVSRGARWTGTGLPAPTQPSVGPLVGRIGLQGHDSVIGADNFYIGPWHVEEDDLVVFSWAADVAAVAFYGHRGRSCELDHPVVVRRTMHVLPDQRAIKDFSDERAGDHGSHDGQDPFPPKRKFAIPKPPPPALSSPSLRPQQSALPIATTLAADQPRGTATSPGPQTAPGPNLRAEAAVKAALAAPRGAGLSALLATLQPEQYELVSRPADTVLAIQGHPGTGKTVIAAHRAAYLVHPERVTTSRAPRILLVGPNQSYAEHVQGVLDSLITQNPSPVTVMGLGRLLAGLRRLMVETSGPYDGEHYEVAIELGDFAEAAAHELRLTGHLTRAANQQEATWMVYEALRRNEAAGVLLTDDPEWMHNLRRLPDFNVAVTSRRYMPLMTQCSLSAVPNRAFIFDHVIVDEAQDVRPLEWRILKVLNSGGTWTLLGDMNQRRSDWSYGSWTLLARDIGLVDEGDSFVPEVFKTGYRSTAAIMQYANRLLPRAERHVDSVQHDGPPPTVQRTTARDLTTTAIAMALDLQSHNPQGTTAIITNDRRTIHDGFLKAGWTIDSQDKRVYRKGGIAIHLLSPEGARGLEFDGVLVVEPADFPPNLGRMGSLYTSLTRANRELAVVHVKGLPDPLKGHGKRVT